MTKDEIMKRIFDGERSLQECTDIGSAILAHASLQFANLKAYKSPFGPLQFFDEVAQEAKKLVTQKLESQVSADYMHKEDFDA